MPLYFLVGSLAVLAALAIFLNWSPRRPDDYVRPLSVSGERRLTGLVAPAPGRAVPVKVLTFNTRHGRRDDGAIDLDGLADIIGGSGADIVALQEVDRFQLRSGLVDQARWLGERLGMQVAFGANLRRGLGEYGNAILSRYPVLSVRNVLLPGRLEQRGVLVARVMTPQGPVKVMATHLGLSRDDRAAQVRAILAEAAGEKRPLILLGDWNTTVEAPELAPLAEAFPSAAGAAGLTPAYTFRAGQSRPYIGIDHIFLSNDWVVRGAAVLDGELSDHVPVVAEIYLRTVSGHS